MRDHLTAKIGGQYHHRAAVNQLRECARSRRDEAKQVCAGIADLLDVKDVDDVQDEVLAETEQAHMLLNDARDIERIVVALARNQTRRAFNLFEDLDTEVRDTIYDMCRAFVKVYEADPKTFWRGNVNAGPLLNSHVPRTIHDRVHEKLDNDSMDGLAQMFESATRRKGGRK